MGTGEDQAACPVTPELHIIANDERFSEFQLNVKIISLSTVSGRFGFWAFFFPLTSETKQQLGTLNLRKQWCLPLKE